MVNQKLAGLYIKPYLSTFHETLRQTYFRSYPADDRHQAVPGGRTLPSTRELGRQLGTSFHTVRKAYHQLADEGLIVAEQGRGFVVIRQSTSLDKSQRLEMVNQNANPA
jgi:DNA-binding FadR family transcriptional regulator